VRAGERPSPLFWAASIGGAVAVTLFAIRQGAGQLRGADALLLAAIAIGGLGYAEGGRLSRNMPGWRVISWGVLLALPVSLPVAIWAILVHPPHPDPTSVAGFLYVSTVSMFFGFFAWYRGLATAGIARASQLQLAQPFLSLMLAAVLLAEHVGLDAIVTAVIVILCVAGTQRARYSIAPAGRQGPVPEVPAPGG
jgi:drug/metabolite transporter (DMT)-like permease